MDNERELYVGAIRRLEAELERAHQRGDRLESLLHSGVLGVVNKANERPEVGQEPLRSSGMSMREAARRVREFEQQVLAKKDEPDAGEISETIQTDADRASRGGSDRQGFAV